MDNRRGGLLLCLLPRACRPEPALTQIVLLPVTGPVHHPYQVAEPVGELYYYGLIGVEKPEIPAGLLVAMAEQAERLSGAELEQVVHSALCVSFADSRELAEADLVDAITDDFGGT